MPHVALNKIEKKGTKIAKEEKWKREL